MLYKKSKQKENRTEGNKGTHSEVIHSKEICKQFVILVYFIDVCISSGWGEIQPSEYPNVLQYINAYRLPADKCIAKTSKGWDDDRFCTISDSKYRQEEDGNGPCVGSGDSGGPMVCFKHDKNNNYEGAYIEGVVNDSIGNKNVGYCQYQDNWADVRKYREWIDPLLVNKYYKYCF